MKSKRTHGIKIKDQKKRAKIKNELLSDKRVLLRMQDYLKQLTKLAHEKNPNIEAIKNILLERNELLGTNKAPITIALQNSHFHFIVPLLLKYDTDFSINELIVDNNRQVTPLYLACASNVDLSIIITMLQMGADPNIKVEGQNPLDIFDCYPIYKTLNKPFMLFFLMAYGADIDLHLIKSMLDPMQNDNPPAYHANIVSLIEVLDDIRKYFANEVDFRQHLIVTLAKMLKFTPDNYHHLSSSLKNSIITTELILKRKQLATNLKVPKFIRFEFYKNLINLTQFDKAINFKYIDKAINVQLLIGNLQNTLEELEKNKTGLTK